MPLQSIVHLRVSGTVSTIGSGSPTLALEQTYPKLPVVNGEPILGSSEPTIHEAAIGEVGLPLSSYSPN